MSPALNQDNIYRDFGIMDKRLNVWLTHYNKEYKHAI